MVSGEVSAEEPLDALIVGAGFSGVYMLKSLRSHGFSVKIFESGSDFGGVWYWNSYPGARVDSDFYVYQFSDPKLYKDFDYPTRFPNRDEVLSYFHHVDKVLDLSKDINFSTTVKSAEFHGDSNSWEVKSTIGTTWCRHLFLCTGFAHKSYTPPFPGLEKFKGEIYHSSQWPKDRKVEFAGKRVSIIGTGASGVQIIQDIGPVTGHLTVYQRTPNLVHPIRQCSVPDPSQPTKNEFEKMFEISRRTFSGFKFDCVEKNAMDCTPDERREIFEGMWTRGGFEFFFGNFPDVTVSKEANDMAYAFWLEKARARIKDKRKQDILAPLIAPHPVNTKRPCLEETYFEVLNQDNVDIIDVNTSPIIEITETGVRTEKEGVLDVDMIVLATGFDSLTGGILKIEIKNKITGRSLQEKWKDGTYTYLGMTTAGFPNMYFMYGPHSPSAFCNGPTSAEMQGEWLTKLLIKMRDAKNTKVEAESDAEKDWRKLVHSIWNAHLFPQAKSWYQGANIPGKPIEPLSFPGGNIVYRKALEGSASKGYEGFKIQ